MGGSVEVLDASMRCGNKGAGEQEVMGGAERMVWVIFYIKISDVAWDRVVSGFV